MKKLFGRGGPFGAFFEFPALLQLAIVSTCAEMTWATLLLVLQYYFERELLVGQSDQFIVSKVALTVLAFTGAETLFKYPMGTLADRYGPRRFVLLALSIGTVTPLLMWLFGTIFHSTAYGWVPFVPLRAIEGFAAAALWPAMSALMSRAVPRESKATAMSVFNAAYVFGLALGPALGLTIGVLLGGNLYVFPFLSVIMAIGFVIAFRTVPHTVKMEGHGESIEEDKAMLSGNPLLLRMLALYALSQVGIGLIAPTLLLYIQSQFHIGQSDLPRLLPIPALFVLAISIPLGNLPDKLGRAKSVWVSYVFAVLGMIGIAGSSLFPPSTGFGHPSLWLFAAGMGGIVVSYLLGTPAWLGLASLQVDDSKQAQVLSLMQTAQGVGVVVASLAVASGGHLLTAVSKFRGKLHHTTIYKHYDILPVSLWFWIALGVFTLVLIGTILFIKEPPHEHKVDEEAQLANSSVL